MGYELKFQVVWDNLPALLHGAWLTLVISVLSIAVGLVIGTLGAIGRTAGPRVVGRVADAYVEVIRNTPLLIQIFLIYFGLPALVRAIDPALAPYARFSGFTAGFLALAIYAGAYNLEVIRAGIEAVPKGQQEAATSSGLSFAQTYRTIILPQGFRISLPALTNNVIAILKQSALVHVTGFRELTFVGYDLNSWTFRAFEVFGAVTVIYLILVFGLSALLAAVERRIAYRV